MGACGSKGTKGRADSDDERKTTNKTTTTPATAAATATTTPAAGAADAKKEPEAVSESSSSESEAKEPEGDQFDDFDENDILTGIKEKYEFLDEVGRGGFSVVYKGKHKESGELFAIKWIKKDTLSDQDDVKLLKREICIMKRVRHDNILKLYEVYEEEDDFYLVMELVQGKELFDRIVERGQYSERDAANIVRQIVSAVDYLHELGIAHRDLKPENLLSYGDPETIKLADFGFSKNFGEEKMVTSVGSPGYVAPEVLTQESYGASVDMWSIGVIIYILLCGYPPFFADTTPELFKKIMNIQYDFDDSNWDYVSDAAKDLIRKLLVKDPKERLNAKQCLADKWVQGEEVGDNNLMTGTKLRDNKV